MAARLTAALVCAALAIPGTAAAAPKKSPAKPPAKIVVQTADQLRNAFRNVRDGGTIELRAGVYRSPSGGFSISNLKKAFTVQAAAGAVVFLDGEGKRPVLRFVNGDRARGKKVTFRRLTFRNGLATPGKTDAGGVTVQAAEAEFVDCVFMSNVSTGAPVGGGALRLSAKALVTLFQSRFEGNGTTRRGGAVEAIDATLAMTGGRFIGNRANLPGHTPSAAGGAVYLQNATATFTDVTFMSNQAAWVGGALYAFGQFAEPVDVPRTAVRLERTSFFGNSAQPAPGQTALSSNQGGAIHVEDQAKVTVIRSAFADNAATVGAAINVYRANVEVTGSIFRNHRASADGSGFGGTIAALSADQADGSTGGGAINRPNARLLLHNSLLQGPLDPALTAAVSGGCVLAAGDVARVSGAASVPQRDTIEENRAEVVLDGVVFSGCTAARSGGAAGTGGAVRGDLIALVLRGGLVLGSSARGTDGAGGGLSLVGAAAATLDDATFAGNSADHSGGAIQVRGARLDVDRSRFLGNSVGAPGSFDVTSSRGAAIFSIPSSRDAVTGVVQGSLFAGEVGVEIRDVDLPAGPVNDLGYDANRFFLAADNFGDRMYAHNPQEPGGLGVAELNNLVIVRPGRSSTDKSLLANTREFAPPAEGALVAVQAAGALRQRLGPFLAFAWTGTAAFLDGAPLGARFGLVERPAPGEHRLDVPGGAGAVVIVEP